MLKNKGKMPQIFFVLVMCVCITVVNCKVFFDDALPYVLTKPQCLLHEREGYYIFAGIEFEFLNTSEKTISKISISCMVYDADTGKNPFIGSNSIRESFLGMLLHKEKKLLILPLDSYIYVAPEKPYFIDYFYVAEIIYTDGSVWKDELGIYYTKSY